MIDLPRGAIREYLIAFGVAAIYVVTSRSGVPSVAVTRDLERSYRVIKEQSPDSDIVLAFWVVSRDVANEIARAVNARSVDDLDAVYVEIEVAAAQLGVRLTNHETAMARATSALRRVDQELARAHQAGELGWFNRGFKRWRKAQEEGHRRMNYTEAKARLRKAVVLRLIAGGFAAGQGLASLEHEVFPATAE